MAGSLVVSNTPPFGALSNQTAAELQALNLMVTRMSAAIANAASGYAGTAGTEYEGNGTNFGVVTTGSAGAQGLAFAYAWNTIAPLWTTFYSAALASIQALDNGVPV